MLGMAFDARLQRLDAAFSSARNAPTSPSMSAGRSACVTMFSPLAGWTN
jgi:hypothetical protein